MKINYSLGDDGGSKIKQVGIVLSLTKNINYNSSSWNLANTFSYQKNDSSFSIKLPTNQSYYCILFVSNNLDTGFSNEFLITPNSINTPVIDKYDVDSITSTSARVTVKILSWGGDKYVNNYLKYSTNAFFPTNQTNQIIGSFDNKNNAITWNLANLRASNKYYFKFATTNSAVWTTEILDNFTTAIPKNPVITKPIILNKLINFSSISYQIIDDGGADFIENGIVYSQSNKIPTMPNDLNLISSAKLLNSPINNILKNLISGQNYIARAYIKRNNNYYYSDTLNFTTYAQPTINYIKSSLDGLDSVNLFLNFQYENSLKPIETGVVLSTISIPDTNNLKISFTTVPISSKDTSLLISQLKKGQLYYSRGYLINQQGIFYSTAMKSFTTLQGIPKLHLSDSISRGIKRVIVKAYIDSRDGLPILKWGVCYNTSGTPTINDNVIYSSNNNKMIADYELNNLIHNTTYAVRVFAINKNGVYYDNKSTYFSDLTPFNGNGGGIVFFDKGYYKDGWRYLESSLSDTISYYWGCSTKSKGNFFNATDTLLGQGYDNTDKIIKNCTDAIFAAKIARSYRGTTSNNDWYLPNVKEVRWATELNGLGNSKFKDWLSYYSTSLEYSDINFWYADATSSGNLSYKADKYTIRTIRRY